MPKIVLLQFETDPGSADRRAAVSSLGAEVVEDEPRWPTFFQTVERVRPDAIVISCGAIPSHGREAARYLGDGFNTRNIAVFVVGVKPHDVAKTREAAPKAQVLNDAELAPALREKVS